MIELIKHIEILLLENDCVIVPELGGFITHYQPAHYEESECVYLPPIRTVGFNPQLTMNDGLLTQSYMQAYHTDFPDASRKIAIKVNELKETLYKEGIVEMSGIGVLHYTIHNTYEFHPNKNGLLSPSLYALDAFTIMPLTAEVIEEPVIEKKPTYTIPVKEKKEIHLNHRWLGNAVAVAVAAILFFVLSVPVENTYIDRGNYASLGTDCLFDAIRSQSMATSLIDPVMKEPQKNKHSNVVPVATKVEKVAPDPTPIITEPTTPKTIAHATPTPKESPKKEVKKEKAPTPQAIVAKKPSTTARKNYHIIVASLATASDAQRMLKEYQQQGHSNASVVEGSGRFRISLCSYTDKSVAYRKMNELKQTEAFKNAWMLTSK